ncbi:hypothetical protein PS2_032820 [Malus domestica]
MEKMSALSLLTGGNREVRGNIHNWTKVILYYSSKAIIYGKWSTLYEDNCPQATSIVCRVVKIVVTRKA